MIKNYKNDVIIPIIERLLPQGTEGWRQVATAYHAASGGNDIRDTDALGDDWVKKLCNNFKKPWSTQILKFPIRCSTNQ